jgi:hypothetical protein
MARGLAFISSAPLSGNKVNKGSDIPRILHVLRSWGIVNLQEVVSIYSVSKAISVTGREDL